MLIRVVRFVLVVTAFGSVLSLLSSGLGCNKPRLGISTGKQTVVIQDSPIPNTKPNPEQPKNESGTVRDDSPLVRLSHVSLSTDEKSNLTVGLSLDKMSSQGVTVSFSIGGSALKGADFIGPSTDFVMIPPGSVFAPLITILDDASAEPSETVEIFLGSVTGATLGSPIGATITILDDDQVMDTPVTGIPFVQTIFFNNATHFEFDDRRVSFSDPVGTVSLRGINQTDKDNNSTEGFGGGVVENIHYDNGLTLDRNGLATGNGSFISRIFDSGKDVSWSKLSWIPKRPSHKELPDIGAAESAYPEGNISMVGNKLLLHMNEAPNFKTIQDRSGFNHHGTCIPGHCPVVSHSGLFGSSLKFDMGQAQFVTLGKGPAISGTIPFSISAWIKTKENTTQEIISQFSENHNRYWSLRVQNSTLIKGAIRFFSYTDSSVGFQIDLYSTKSVTDGNWHHVVAVREQDGSAALYIDGKLDARVASAFPTNLEIQMVRIGVRCGDICKNYFNGSMDELALFENRALSPPEVWDFYTRAFKTSLQLRVCTEQEQTQCATEPFLGPDGKANSFYTELENSTGTPPNFLFPMPLVGRFLQYRLLFESFDPANSPKMMSVMVGPEHYYAGGATILNKEPLPFESLSSISQMISEGTTGTVTFRLSTDKLHWYYYDGVQWLITTQSYHRNTLTQVNAGISHFMNAVAGVKRLYIELMLNSDGQQSVGLRKLEIRGLR